MKNRIFSTAALCAVLLATAVFAVGVTKLVDDFERNPDLKTPEWWKFDNVTVSVVSNPVSRPGDRIAKSCGKYSMSIKGSAKNYYCGGIGTYVGIDATVFSGIEMAVYGNGETSGKIKIELYDDDKGKWSTQYDDKWIPLKDDIWYFEQQVDWSGWKVVSIPFSSFALSNPGRGDGKINFNQNNGSGGLLQIQMIFLAPRADGEVNMNIDNVKLINVDESE